MRVRRRPGPQPVPPPRAGARRGHPRRGPPRPGPRHAVGRPGRRRAHDLVLEGAATTGAGVDGRHDGPQSRWRREPGPGRRGAGVAGIGRTRRSGQGDRGARARSTAWTPRLCRGSCPGRRGRRPRPRRLRRRRPRKANADGERATGGDAARARWSTPGRPVADGAAAWASACSRSPAGACGRPNRPRPRRSRGPSRALRGRRGLRDPVPLPGHRAQARRRPGVVPEVVEAPRGGRTACGRCGGRTRPSRPGRLLLSAWWVNHVDAHLACCSDERGPFFECRKGQTRQRRTRCRRAGSRGVVDRAVGGPRHAGHLRVDQRDDDQPNHDDEERSGP